MGNILIVDLDLGFVFWLGETLCAAGYFTLAGHDVPGAVSLVDELDVPMDLLIFDPSLDRAMSLVDYLLESNPRLKTIAVTAGASDGIPSAKYIPRPEQADEAAKAEWLSAIRHVLGEAASAAASDSQTGSSSEHRGK